MKKLQLFFVALVVFSLVGVQTALAAEFIAPSKTDNGIVTIDSGVHKNVYTAGSTVSVTTPISGDLFVAGRSLSIKSPIEQDLNAAGQSVNIEGAIGGDVRVAGSDVNISGTIGGDLLAAGSAIILAESAKIGGDANVAGADVVINSPIAGKLRVGGANITINSEIGGDVWVESGTNVVFGAKAKAGKVVYQSPKQAEIKDGAQLGSVEFKKLEKASRSGNTARGLVTTGSIVKLLAMFILAWLMIHFLPSRTREILDETKANMWADLGIGFALVICLPILAVLLMITVVGYLVGFVVLALWLLLLVVSAPFMVMSFGRLFEMLALKRMSGEITWQTAGIGALLAFVLMIIPVVGWIILLAFYFMAVGSVAKVGKRSVIN